jgi:MFS family permease
MLSAIWSVQSLLVAIALLMGGTGVMSTLTSSRLEASGAPAFAIGIVATAYFAGLTLGALQTSAVVRRVGHIRAFSAFVALLSASTVAYSLHQNQMFWLALRLLDGFCVAGVYVCLESWLNERAEPGTRGGVLAAYMIALYGGQAAGQIQLNLGGAAPFVTASILISLAIVPVALTRAMSPALGDQPRVTVRRLYEMSPLGLVGAAVVGIMIGAFYGLGAVYAQRLGLQLAETAAFMSAVIVGGVALQWPLGMLSDFMDRRSVIIGVLAGASLSALGLGLFSEYVTALAFGAMFGGFSFALYPLCVAHTHDHVSAADRVSASGGLVLVYSAGAAVGPLAGAASFEALGPKGLFIFIAACGAGALVFALWRVSARASVPNALQRAFQMQPRTTPVSARLDPLAEEEIERQR